MIGKLKGIVDEIGEEELVLDVGGVGYLVAASARTLRALPAVGQAAALLIETQVREDAIRLYGFLTAGERDWFRLLQSVQGVGAKVALGILGALTADALSAAIARLRAILADEKLLFDVIVMELEEIREKYADKRRTEIVASGAEINEEDLIQEEDMVVTISHAGYVKRTSPQSYRSQKRGGRGKIGREAREEDWVTSSSWRRRTRTSSSSPTRGRST